MATPDFQYANRVQPERKTEYKDWTESDLFHNKYLIKPDADLAAVVKSTKDNNVPDIAVSEAQGKFQNLIARSIGAKNIIEVGTLAGYSAIWFAKALPEGGKLICLDIDEDLVKIATENVKNAGLSDKVDIRLGPAVESLEKIEPNPPIDLMFIDADKPNNVAYFKHAKRLVRKGGVIIVDNVVRRGRVSRPDYTDNDVEGVRQLLKLVSEVTEVDATTIATVGTKGYDGFMYCLRL